MRIVKNAIDGTNLTTKVARNAELLLSLQEELTNVKSRHDSTNHACMLVLAAPRFGKHQDYKKCVRHQTEKI